MRNFEAHAPTAVTVRAVLVHEGDHVRQGQLLVRLDDSQARAQTARAQAQLKAAQAENSAVESGGTRTDVLNLQDQLAKAQEEQRSAQANLAAIERLQQTGAASEGELAAAKTRLENANASLHVLQQRKAQPFSQGDIQRVQAGVGEAEAALSASHELLQQTDIRSTVDGTVYQIPVRPGNFVNAGDLIVQVANLDDLQVRAFVDEPEIGKLALGEPVLISWDALPTEKWSGQVKTVPKTVVQRGTRNVGEILCSVEQNPQARLLPNVNVNVSIQVARKDNVLTVPRESVHTDGTGTYVLIVKDGQLARVAVRTGISSLTRVEVTGVREGEQVAVSSATGELLVAGMHVKTPSP
ncbi:MAG: efflux RND transporter periplasmic adaptor subunit [Acidobacteriales bacterium]|nr:efflux RND transporter periplasmic adaptor subunit [Terriglobales bacterium]